MKTTSRWLVLPWIMVLALAACSPNTGQTNHATGKNNAPPADVSILNVSYDPTRELYQQYNRLFQQYWQKKTGQNVTIQQANGGSGKQSLAVQNGLKADVVTLALGGDIDALNQGGKRLLRPDWQKTLPDNSTPYTSTIVFLVRKGNPKHIKDWNDLTRHDVQVITPNPKTSGGARWNFLAAWIYARHQPGGNDSSAEKFVAALYKQVAIMDTGARGSTMSFTQRGLGDVLIAWENEALLAQKASGGQFDVITPSISILCEPPVAVVDAVADAKGTRQVASEYLKYLYSTDAQRIIAKNFYRPVNPAIKAEFNSQFPALKLVNINEEFGGWKQAQARFFADGGVFDHIYNKH